MTPSSHIDLNLKWFYTCMFGYILLYLIKEEFRIKTELSLSTPDIHENVDSFNVLSHKSCIFDQV